MIIRLNKRPVGASSEQTNAFTLLEVIIACAIFFMVAFAVLQLVIQGLGAARSLQQREPDAGLLAATLSKTNRLEEGTESGDFEDIAPGLYTGYSWERYVEEIGSNSLFKIDFIVFYNKARGKRKGASESHMSMLLYVPGSPPGSASGRGGSR
jgi:hypothetical protein